MILKSEHGFSLATKREAFARNHAQKLDFKNVKSKTREDKQCSH